MIDIAKALKLIDRETGPLGTEKADLADAVGRVLAEHIVADTDLPPFDRSQMDGYAVIASDTLRTRAQSKGIFLEIVGESVAGRGWRGTLERGEAVRIMTGAPVPDGADAVQKLELTTETIAPPRGSGADGATGAAQRVEIREPTEKGRYIIRIGSEVRKGTVVLKSGIVITENMIAMLAAFGCAKVRVGKRPRIAILGTGSEIVEIAKKPGRDQIRNSNSVMLDVFCRRFGAATTVFPIVKDDLAGLKTAIKNAAKKSDIVILTGGVSVGKYDHTKTALAELGAEIFFEKVRLKPGKPAVFARLDKTLVFGLPGNPVSAAVTFHLFVRKAIMKMQGAVATDMRKGFAVLGSDVRAAKDRDTYLPSRVETTKLGQLTAHPLKWQGSSDFIGFAQADSLIFIPQGRTMAAGETASIVYL